MKDDEDYIYYIKYLDGRLKSGKLQKGSYSLLRICENSFDNFKYKFNNDSAFNKILKRDKKLNDLLYGDI